jgi:uncharacterized protein YcbK (DUF882 family)
LKILIPLLLIASPALFAESRSLAFYHTHTGQSLETEYYRDGAYVPAQVARINRFLGDFRSGDAHNMDPELLDLLHTLHVQSGSRKPFEVISAYRSPVTNEMLRSRSEDSGVARKSMHLLGRAIDVRLADVPLDRLRDIALGLRRGGVGFYPGSNFIHVDTGAFRRW